VNAPAPDDWRRMAAWLDANRPVFKQGTYRRLKMLWCVLAGPAFSNAEYQRHVGHLLEDARRIVGSVRPADRMMAALVRLLESDPDQRLR